MPPFLILILIFMVPCLTTAARSKDKYAYDCTESPQIWKNFTLKSFQAMANSLEPPHLKHLQGGGINRYTAAIAINALLTDQIFFLESILANLTDGEILILINQKIYWIRCPKTKITMVKEKECHELPLVKTENGTLKYLNHNGYLQTFARETDCDDKDNIVLKLAKAFDSVSLIRTSSKILGLGLFKSQKIAENFAKLFNMKSAQSLVELEEQSMDSVFGRIAIFARQHGPKLSICYVIAYALAGIIIVIVAVKMDIQFVKALSLVINPIKLYFDFKKLRKEKKDNQRQAELNKRTTSFDQLESEDDIVDDMLNCMEKLLTRVEKLEHRYPIPPESNETVYPIPEDD